MIQIIIVASYFCVSILLGIFSKKKVINASHFEGNSLGLIMCVAIGAGEWMGGSSTTGVSEYGYLYGISGAWYTISNGIGICFLAIFFAKMFRRLNVRTVPEIIGKYLGDNVRVVASIFLTLVIMAVGTSQLISLGTLGETVLGLSKITAIVILGLGVLLYTFFGGMIAVGYTNVVHLLTIIVGMLVALCVCANKTGDIRFLQDTLPKSYFSPVAIGYNRVISWIIASTLGACTAQAGLQPILRSKDELTARKSSFLIALIVAPFGLITAFLGMYCKVLFPNIENPKLALPELLLSLNPYLSGIVFAALFAAIISTASPIFLSMGTLITRDVYSLKINKKDDERQLLKKSRIITMIMGVLCITGAVVLSLTNIRILDIVYWAYSLRGCLFIILVLALFWKRMSPQSAIVAMIVTAVIGLVWVIYNKIYGHYPIPVLTETYVAIISTLLMCFIVSVMRKK